MRYAYVVLSALHISCLINHNRKKKLSLKRYFEQISGFKYFRKIQNALLVGFMLNITPGVNIDEIWHKDSLSIYLAVYLLSRVFLVAAILGVAQEVSTRVILAKITIVAITGKISLMIKWYQ